jgi:hypothetical protein
MSTALNIENPIDDPPPDDDNADHLLALALNVINNMRRDKTSLQAIITELENERARRNWRQLTERIEREKKDAEIWLPLTMAAIEILAPYSGEYTSRMQKTHYERVRGWCEDDKVIAKQDDSAHWFVEMNSALAYAAKKGIVP